MGVQFESVTNALDFEKVLLEISEDDPQLQNDGPRFGNG